VDCGNISIAQDRDFTIHQYYDVARNASRIYVTVLSYLGRQLDYDLGNWKLTTRRAQ